VVKRQQKMDRSVVGDYLKKRKKIMFSITLPKCTHDADVTEGKERPIRSRVGIILLQSGDTPGRASNDGYGLIARLRASRGGGRAPCKVADQKVQLE